MSEIVAKHLSNDRFRGLSKSDLLPINPPNKEFYTFPFALWIE
jgi:hypothetical protein